MIWLVLVLAVVAFVLWSRENGKRVRHPVPPGHQTGIAVPHTQPFELYHNAFSLCSMKVRVCLAELGVEYASHHIDLVETGAYENIRPKLLSVNPAGSVPVLVHDGHPIYESHEQIRYAALHAPAGAPQLVPDDAELRAEMEAWIDRSSITGDPMSEGDRSAGNTVPGLTVPLFATMIEKIPVSKIAEGLLFHFDKRRPVLFLVLKLAGIERFGSLGPAPKVLAKSRGQMAAHLDDLETKLAGHGGPWLLGDTFSLADVSWLVIFERLRQGDVDHVFLGDGRRPACTAYWERLQKRDSYRQAITDHAHPLVEYGTGRIVEAKAAHPDLRRILEGE